MNTILDQAEATIRSALARGTASDHEWVESKLELCKGLAAARTQFPSNQAFGVWFDGKQFTLNHQDRAAALNMAKDLPLARTILEATQRRSLQHIWSEEMQPRLTHVSKTTRNTPKKNTSSSRSGRRGTVGSPKLDKARAIVRPMIESEEAVSPHKLAEEHGISHVTFDMAITAELGRMEGIKEAGGVLNRPARADKNNKRRMVNIPYTVGAHPLQEVPGRPSFADDPVGFDEHMAKYGRTPVHLPAVTDLLEADGKTTHLVDALKPLLYEYVPTVEQFFDFIDHMLRHVPDSTASNGLEKPYAAKARATLAKLEERLPKVVALVNALDDQLRSRKANRDKSRSAPEGASLH